MHAGGQAAGHIVRELQTHVGMIFGQVHTTRGMVLRFAFVRLGADLEGGKHDPPAIRSTQQVVVMTPGALH